MTTRTNHIISAAIDFGTTFSGYAFSTRNDFHSSPDKVSLMTWTAALGGLQSQKTSTSVLFTPDKKFYRFGFDAEDKYLELYSEKKGRDWYFFRRFKMDLYKAKVITADMQMTSVDRKLLPAIDVFSASIGYLKDHLLQACTIRGLDLLPHDIQWVLTVPAIWDDSAKLFMRKAAIKAGILSETLVLALEPEAASLYCKTLHFHMSTEGDGEKTLSTFKPGAKYMVVDAGGGTVDITVHEVESNGTLREMYAASGGDWGGTMVDKEFERLLSNFFGQDAFKTFKTVDTEDYLEILMSFEVKKRKQSAMNFSLPVSLLDLYKKLKTSKEGSENVTSNSENITLKNNRLRISYQCIRSLFESSIDHIVKHLKTLMKDPRVANISSIIMVGGYSECSFLRETVIQEFPSKRVIVPPDAGLAVLKGAVITGHTPSAITHRVCRYTYGIGSNSAFIEGVHDEERRIVNARGKIRCRGTFERQVSVGDAIRVGHKGKVLHYQVRDEQSTYMKFNVYISTQKDPLYTDDCKKIGVLRIEMPDTTEGLEREADVQMIFGGSEITVEATNIFTGEKQSANVDFA